MRTVYLLITSILCTHSALAKECVLEFYDLQNPIFNGIMVGCTPSVLINFCVDGKRVKHTICGGDYRTFFTSNRTRFTPSEVEKDFNAMCHAKIVRRFSKKAERMGCDSFKISTDHLAIWLSLPTLVAIRNIAHEL